MDLLDYIQQKQRRLVCATDRPVVLFDQFVDDQLLAFEDGNLEKKYPEFRMLMKEYRDGYPACSSSLMRKSGARR